MVFSSSLFLFYFLPAFLTLYLFTPVKLRNLLILLASILFYAWGAPFFVFVLSGMVVADFFLALVMDRYEGRPRKLLLFLGVALHVSMLLYFKYANFFMDNLNALLGTPIAFTRIALPIGISFFVFHELSYIIDVYRKVKAPLKNITDYALYIFLFPQLIAGPIIRFNEITDQIRDRNYQDTIDHKLAGLFRFAVGLAKKVLIANALGEVADKIFGMPAGALSFTNSWIGALCYTFQIYFDFSGYSDMAIGLALTMGFKFPENFNSPYTAQSITEFWSRWHMSLSRWMRDYLYIPLGGNRISAQRTYINLCVVFLLSGIWHGAQWTFAVWGAYHGIFLILERSFLLKVTSRIGKWARILLTFFIVVVGWIFFRSDTIGHALSYIGRMFSFDLSAPGLYLSPKIRLVLLLAAVCSFIAAFQGIANRLEHVYAPQQGMALSMARFLVASVFIIICFSSITSSGFNPFIYFKF